MNQNKSRFGYRLIHLLPALSFVKATAWVMLGISTMFAVEDLTIKQADDIWLSPLIRFSLAVAFLLAGIFFQKDSRRNVYFLLIVILIDVIVSTQSPIGLFDILMLIFDVFLYWLIFIFLTQERV